MRWLRLKILVYLLTSAPTSKSSFRLRFALFEPFKFFSHSDQFIRYFLTGFLKDFDQILSVSPVTPFNKGNRRPGFPGSSSASATMNVIFNVTWEIIVDDMGDVLTKKKLKLKKKTFYLLINLTKGL